MKLSYLSPTPAGDGDIFYGPQKVISNSTQFVSLSVIKLHEDKALAALFPGQTILGLPPDYRTEVDRLEGDCSERKAKFQKSEYFDSDNNLVYVNAPITPQEFEVKESTPLALRLALACGAPVPSVGVPTKAQMTRPTKLGQRQSRKSQSL